MMATTSQISGMASIRAAGNHLRENVGRDEITFVVSSMPRLYRGSASGVSLKINPGDSTKGNNRERGQAHF